MKKMLLTILAATIASSAWAFDDIACNAAKKLNGFASIKEQTAMLEATKALEQAVCLGLDNYVGGGTVFDRGVFYYKNGTVAASDKKWFYPNGSMAFSDMVWYFPDGTVASDLSDRPHFKKGQHRKDSSSSSASTTTVTDSDASSDADTSAK